MCGGWVMGNHSAGVTDSGNDMKFEMKICRYLQYYHYYLVFAYANIHLVLSL